MFVRLLFFLCISVAWNQAEALIPAINSRETKLAFSLAQLCTVRPGKQENVGQEVGMKLERAAARFKLIYEVVM